MNEAPTWAEFVQGWELGVYSPPVLCGVVAGLVLGAIGVFVVLRRMVFVTVALSQASGLGVALSFFAGIHLGIDVHPVVGALAITLATAALFIVRTDRLGLSKEGLLGLIYLGTWAASIIVGEKIAQEAHDIAGILFGTAVLVEPIDVVLVVTVGAVVLAVHALFHRGLVFVAFDPVGAEVQGLPVRVLDLTGWVLLALEVSVATRALGVLPVFAFAVLPAMAALTVIRRRIRWVLVLAAALGALSGGAGYLAAFFLELPVGASQAAVAVVLFLASLLYRLIAGRDRG
jgi:zinc transport system permease protein